MMSIIPVLSKKLTRLSLLLILAGLAAALILSIVIQPAQAQTTSDWQYVTILPESGNWNLPGFFLLTTDRQVTVSWEIKCTEGGGCGGREAEFVYDFTFGPGETIRVGWGHQCYRWQFDPIDWPHGYIAEPEPEICYTPTPTDPVTVTATATTETSTPTGTVITETATATNTPTSTGTIVITPPTTPGTATPTSTGTIIITPPTTPGTATPTSTGTISTVTATSTGTIITTPPATPGTPTPVETGTPTTTTPNQSPTETPRSQLIAVTGADLSASSSLLPRIFISLGIVFLGLGLVKVGLNRNSRRQ